MPSAGMQFRLDPADGRPHTLQEMRAKYKHRLNRKAVHLYWRQCTLIPRPRMDERRRDPADGVWRTRAELGALLEQYYAHGGIEVYWWICEAA